MKVIKLLLIYTFFFLFTGCLTGPKNFTILYNKTDTGLSQLIDINGCYISQFGCDSLFYSIFTFYPDGLFRIATASQLNPDLINCFKQAQHPEYCQYPVWGTYKLTGDTIRTQSIRPEGAGCIIFRDYLILPDKQIINLSDYVEPEHTDLGYMKNYPSYTQNNCPANATFIPLESKLNATECPYYHKKWFNTK